MDNPIISIIIPAFNEEENIELLFAELFPVAEQLGVPYEILFIDDASTDKTSERVSSFCKSDSCVRGIRLLCNTRKGGALEVGFHEARGEMIVTIDADLQDDPQEIPRLIAELKQGADAVIGWKEHRKDSFTKKIPSFFMNLIASCMVGRRIHDMNTGLKAYRSSVIRSLALPGSLFRFIPLILLSKGYRVAEIPVHHRQRRLGKSKFGLGHRLRGVFDLMSFLFIWKFGERPLHLFGGCGLLLFSVGAGIGLHLSALWFQGHAIGGRPLLLLSVLLMVFGIQFISTGLIGELLLHSQERSKRLPPYTSLS